MSSPPTAARFKCKHCGILFTKRSNWTRHESNANVHNKPPRRRPGAPNAEGEGSESSTSGPLSPVSSRVKRGSAWEPEGLSTRRRSRAAEIAQLKRPEQMIGMTDSIYEAPTQSVDTNALKITIRPRRSKRPRLSFDTLPTLEEKPVIEEAKEVEPVPLSMVPHRKHRRAQILDARNTRFKKWVRVIKRARWVPGETAPGTPNPLPRQLVRQRAREYAAMAIDPGSKIPEDVDRIYDVDWADVLRTFDDSVQQSKAQTTPIALEELGESSTDSDSSLWDSD